MTKQEALKKIEELKKFVEGTPKEEVGQIWKGEGRTWIVVHSNSDFDMSLRLISLASGKFWDSNRPFTSSDTRFTYVGKSCDFLKGVLG
jgi:hypothetical protein